MNDLVLVVLLGLASYRVSRLVVEDQITEPLFGRVRDRLESLWIRRNTEPGTPEELRAVQSELYNSRLSYMLSCYWCLGFWVSGAITVIVSLAHGLDYPVMSWLAASTMTGIIGSRYSD